MPALDDLLGRLWDDYVSMNPHARAVWEAFREAGETPANDHIAFRTFDDPRVGIDSLARAFVDLGYRPADAYDFPAKKLRARHYEHPEAGRPRVFVSELRLAECSDGLRAIVGRLLDQVPPDLLRRPDLCLAGRPWRLSRAEYETLARESEYAAWVAAHGFRPNHFTVDVNSLRRFRALADVNAFLKSRGFRLNVEGGEIKGSPADHLEQSSTMAGEVEVEFTDGRMRVPACYYEFARRYPLPDGRIFSGFVAQSADKIFESTYRKPA